MQPEGECIETLERDVAPADLAYRDDEFVFLLSRCELCAVDPVIDDRNVAAIAQLQDLPPAELRHHEDVVGILDDIVHPLCKFWIQQGAVADFRLLRPRIPR